MGGERNWFRSRHCTAISIGWLVAWAMPLWVVPNGNATEAAADLRVGAAAVHLKCDEKMVLAGMLDGRFSAEQEGELRVVAVVVQRTNQSGGKQNHDVEKLAIVGCDVLWVPRDLVDSALDEVRRKTGIAPDAVLINASHTHHAPSPAPAHNFGVSAPFRKELRDGIVAALIAANAKLQSPDAAAVAHYHLGEEKTVGANSRLRLPNDNITWINPMKEARESGGKIEPTGPFDPQLPVLDFRSPAGASRAIIFNHSTHTIGTKSNRNVRSPSFYGLAAQELESELGCTVNFLEGASGSTHNIAQVPVIECIARMKLAVMKARSQAKPIAVDRLASIRRPFRFTVRKFDEAAEDARVARYTARYTPQQADFIRNIFATMRRQLAPQRGTERVTWVQAMRIGDVAIVGAPAEYFTALGVDIKKRSPFPNTIVAELANDWVGYLPTRQGHMDGGYQTWMGLHSYAEIGTGERVADEIVAMLEELAGKRRPANPPSDAAVARSPAEEKASFRLADPTLHIQLVAAEPDVVSPVAMAWDADGRLYVVEMFGYPQTPNACRIVRLEDADGDGLFERRTVFADGLSFPTSVCPSGKGILTAAAPDILYLEDADGDGKADVRRVVWTGFGVGSQQLRANALHYGLDNWIYGANGRCDGAVRAPSANGGEAPAISIRGRDFRWHATTRVFEPLIGQSQFGQAHNDFGDRFLSWNTIPLRHVVLEDRHLRFAPEKATAAVVDLTPSADPRRVWTIAAPPRQFNAEPADHYNALCGLSICRSDALGPQHQGVAFVGESLGSAVIRRALRRDGPTYRVAGFSEDREFLASIDNWFHPVFTAIGPDGALYIADFYRQYVEHPIYVASEALRKQVPWRSGAEHGRIWRIVRADWGMERTSLLPLQPARKLSSAPSVELVKLLENHVGWQRDTAQRLLVERGDRTVVPALVALLKSTRTLAVVHALWTLEGLGSLEANVLQGALRHADAEVRRQALRLVEMRLPTASETDVAGFHKTLEAMADDVDQRVRFQWALTSRLMPSSQRLPMLARMYSRIECTPWDRLAMVAATSDAPHEFALLLDRFEPRWWSEPAATQFDFLVELGQCVFHNVAPESQKTFLKSLERGHPAARHPGTLALFSGWLEACLSRGKAPNEGLPGIEGMTLQQAGRAMAANSKAPLTQRLAAIGCLVVGDLDATRTICAALLVDADERVVGKAAQTLADRNELAGCRLLFADWERRPQRVRRAALAAVRRSKAAKEALLEALEQNHVAAVELPLDVEAALRDARSSSLELSARFAKLVAQTQNQDRAKVVADYQSAASQTGDVRAGAAVFRDQCLTCHAVAGVGNRVGPDLAGAAVKPKAELLVDVLDPSRKLSPDFVGYIATTKSGQVHAGLLVAETERSATLRQERGVEKVIPRAELEELRAGKKSFMPDGLEKKIDARQMADLLEFLRQPDRDLLADPPR